MRDYCHVKGTVKTKDTGPVEPASERDEKVSAGVIREAVCRLEPGLCFLFPLEKVYISCQVFQSAALSLLQLGHTAMLACTYTHKHNEVCTRPPPRYIIVSAVRYRLSGAPVDSWKADRRGEGEEGEEGESAAGGEQQTDSLQCSAERQSHIQSNATQLFFGPQLSSAQICIETKGSDQHSANTNI